MSKTIAILLSISLAIAPGCAHWGPKETAYQKAHQAPSETDFDADRSDDDTLVGIGAALVFLPFVFIYDQIHNQVEVSRGNTPARAAREMDDPSGSPDTHRQGIVDLVTQWKFTHRPPYTTRYQQIAQSDPNDTVRAMAIRALNICRDQSATPIFIAALDDDSELVRLEAAKALNNIPDPNAIPALLRCLEGRRDVLTPGRYDTEESKDVRIAAANALRHYHTLEVARSLVSQLDNREFGIAWQSHRSLVLLTGRDFRYDELAWLQFLTGPENPFG